MIKSLTFLLSLLLVHLVSSNIAKDTFGVVNIQNVTDVISVTNNVDGGSLSVYLIAVNDTGSGTVYDPEFIINESVLVSCESVTPYTGGDAVVDFHDTLLPKGDIEGDVFFNISEQGREVEIRCRGQSQSTPEDVTDIFDYDTSQGSPGYLVVKKSPIVSFCDPFIEVPNAEEIISSTVTLELSEPVDQYDVAITCRIEQVADNETFLIIVFEEKIATPGMDSIVMEYAITRRGSPVLVSCTANSSEGTQYLTDTSASASTMFVLSTGSVELLPSLSNVHAPTFTSFLVLSEILQPGEGEITFICELVSVNDTESALETIDDPLCVYPDPLETGTARLVNSTDCFSDENTTCPTTEATPVSAAPNVSQTSPWILPMSEFVFEEGEKYKEVVAELRSPYGYYKGSLLLTCCAAYNINTSHKYTNTSAALAILSDVEPVRAVNASNVPDVSVGLQETELLNTAYVEVSPCPCDIYSNKCDIDCCCDMDCSEEDVLMLSCMAGIPGGDFTPTPDYLCDTISVYHPDWFPFLCVEVTNSPHLGIFYTTLSGVSDISSFNSLKSRTASSTTTSYQDTSSRILNFDETPGSVGYMNGYPVELLYDSNLRGYLTLPMASQQGECASSSMVKFQEDFSSRCSQTFQSSSCADLTSFSARTYLQSSASSYPPCPVVPLVLSEYGRASTASATIGYYCMDDDDNVDYYLRSAAGHKLNVTKTELFGEAGSASNDSIPRCIWDDGYSVPLAPTYNPETQTCDNVVLEVEYQLFWRGGAILGVDSSIILGSVPVTWNLSQVDPEDDYDFVTAPPIPSMAPTERPRSTTTVTGEPPTDLVTDLEDILADLVTDLPADLTISPTAPAITTQIMSSTTQAMLTSPFLSASPADPTINFLNVTTPTYVGTTMTPGTTTAIPNLQESEVQTLTQHFKVTFIHIPEEQEDSDLLTPDTAAFDIYEDDTLEQYQRSGNPGYDIGAPVLSGSAVFEVVDVTTPAPVVNCTVNVTDPSCNTTSEVFSTAFSRVDTSDGNRLALINPGVSGLCSEASTREVIFGEDTISGCLLRLSLSDLSNCTELRDCMKEQLMRYVSADLVGKTGNADVLQEGDWATIFSPDDMVVSPDPTESPTQEPPTSSAVPGTQETAVTGPGYSQYADTHSIMEQLTGVCYDVPTGLNLELIIADVGEINGYVIQEILAANITYTYSTLQLSCSGADGIRCQSSNTTGIDEEYVQSFMVTTTVTFTKVSATPPEPVILFFKDYNPSLCKQDTCWREMLYPITESFQGDSYTYSLAVAIVIVLITTGYLIVTKPWLGLTIK